MVEEVKLPTYETLLTEAIKSLVMDSGIVSSPVALGGNALTDSTKNWANNVHKNRLAKIIRGSGVGQLAVISGNSSNTLIIRGTWPQAIGAGAIYVILEKDLAQILRDVFGAGIDIDLATEFDELKAALMAALEASIDSGIATGGSNTTIVDTGKSWTVNMWADATFEVAIGTTHYLGFVISNTATAITFAALAGGAIVVAGCEYSLKRPVTLADISDRAARLLGVIYGSQGQQLLQRAVTFDLIAQLRHAGVEIDPRAIRALTAADIVTIQSLTQWGGTALTSRDISLDLANLDVALSTIAAEATLAKLIPIAKAAIFNTALPAAEANWIGTDIEPTNSPSYLRIYACVSVTGILRVARTVSAVTVTEDLNSGTALVADAAYMFTIPWRSGDSINIRYSVTTGTIKRLLIDEIGGAE